MDIEVNNPPRTFVVGINREIEMRDCGKVALAHDEQVTFLTESGAEYDVARKSWGFYATPSLNGRLPQFGLRAVLVRNHDTGRYFVMLVEEEHQDEFLTYCSDEALEVIAWLDSDENLKEIAAGVSN